MVVRATSQLIGGIELNKHVKDGAYKYGRLPEMAPLAAAFVPMQEAAYPAYDAAEALSRGTLFPGLDLPFMNIVNKELLVCPKTELMAICFVADELELYLDTHKDDKEAFSMYQTFLSLKHEAHERYRKLFGPVSQEDMLYCDSYRWLDDPWPWDYQTRTEG